MRFLSLFKFNRLNKKLIFLKFLLEKEESNRKVVLEKQDKINEFRRTVQDSYIDQILANKWLLLESESGRNSHRIINLKHDIKKIENKLNNLK